MTTLSQFFYGAGGGTAAVNVQVFTSSGTFNPPTGVTQVCVTMCGGGGGYLATGGTSTFGSLVATGGASYGPAPGAGGTGTIPGGIGGAGTLTASAGTSIFTSPGISVRGGGAGLGQGGAAGQSATPGTGGGGGGGCGGGGIIYKQVLPVSGPVAITIGAGGIGNGSVFDPGTSGGPGICIVEW